MINIFVIFLVILLLIVCFKSSIESLENKYSSLTNKSYQIRDELPNSDDTVDILAKLDLFIDDLIVYLDSKHPNDKRVKLLQDRLYNNKNSLGSGTHLKINESEWEKGVSSYTINKGELLSICVRKKNESKNFHDYQTLLFVLIHELAHIASKSKGHNSEFMENFKFLLKNAVESKMYYPQDYSKNPITYCGVKVTNNPYFN